MPFIDCKFTQQLTPDEKENIKSGLGKLISIMHKPESYLMVGIEENYTLYLAGTKLEAGAYISISLFGTPKPSDCEKMTSAVCDLIKKELGINGTSVYITYHGVENWGYNGNNF